MKGVMRFLSVSVSIPVHFAVLVSPKVGVCSCAHVFLLVPFLHASAYLDM